MVSSRRNKISSADKLRLIRAYRNDEDYIHVADILGVSRSSARSFVSKAMKRKNLEDGEEKPRGGARNIKVDGEMRSLIVDALGRNPAITIKDLNLEMRRQLPDKPHIRDRYLGKVCHDMFYTLKKLEAAPFDR